MWVGVAPPEAEVSIRPYDVSFADIDLGNVWRRRREVPWVKEACLALLSRELDRLTEEGGDL